MDHVHPSPASLGSALSLRVHYLLIPHYMASCQAKAIRSPHTSYGYIHQHVWNGSVIFAFSTPICLRKNNQKALHPSISHRLVRRKHA